jgi:hypothetical protein
MLKEERQLTPYLLLLIDYIGMVRTSFSATSTSVVGEVSFFIFLTLVIEERSLNILHVNAVRKPISMFMKRLI